ncbi:MAG TPA: hypothetical protein VM261_17155 [Kofleriaceae bacterium]|nr:hypothetical protein [Kofleriaceae bacterium]
MHASRFLLGALALSLLIAGSGCKVAPGKVPVASPITTFEAPDREDVFPDEDAAEGDAAAGGDFSDSDDGN